MNKLYITIAGKSNVGKSSFINHLCNNYVTPESSKLQTTRINTYHSFINKNSEIIFIDTPGISVVKKDLMSDFMKKSYIKSLDIADAVLIIFDISKKGTKNESSIIKICEENNIPVFISVNKIDLYKDDSILFEKIEELSNLYNKKIYPLSIHNNIGIDLLLNDICKIESSTKKNISFQYNDNDKKKLIIQELIRGIINNIMYGEVPYESAVVVDVLENKEKLIRIKSTIIVNNTNQKKILIGTSGQNIKKIGIESRLLIEKIYSKDVYIDLIVKVNENWKNDIQILKKIGFAS